MKRVFSGDTLHLRKCKKNLKLVEIAKTFITKDFKVFETKRNFDT
jgi:hypothetical protein